MEKEKTILSTKIRQTSIIAIIVVLILYLFFFTSKITFPEAITSKKDVTKIGKEYEFSSNRTYSLVSCKYSKEDRQMEIVLNLTNNNFDSINEYFVSANVIGASNNITINEKLNEQLLAVYVIDDLKKFDEMTFMFAPKLGKLEDITDEDTAFLTLNKNNVEYVSKIEDKTKEEYMLERLNSTIAENNKKLKSEEKKLGDLKEKVAELESENRELLESQKYLTSDEINVAKSKIIENKEVIKTTENDISIQEQNIENIKSIIKEAKEKLTNLEGKSR